MIYLIDDKKIRQEKDFNWDDLKFELFQNELIRIFNNRDLDEYKTKMFAKGNIILFHESFQDNSENKTDVSAEKIRQKLIEYVQDKEILLVLFSGSIASTSFKGNLAYTSPSVIYNNLEYILNKVRKGDDLIIENLLFGANFKIEILLELKNRIWKFLYDKKGDIEVNHSLYSLVEEYNCLTGKQIVLDDTVNVEYLKFLLNE